MREVHRQLEELRGTADPLEELAKRIAKKPSFALKLAKEAVNAAQDAQGRVNAMQTSFAMHQLCHAHNVEVHGMPIDPAGIMSKGLKKNIR